VLTRVGAKGQDTGNRGFGSGNSAVVASAEAALNAPSVREGEEGCDEVVWVDTVY